MFFFFFFVFLGLFVFFLIQQSRHRSRLFQSLSNLLNKIIQPEAQKKEIWHWCSPAESPETVWQKGKQKPPALQLHGCVTQLCQKGQPHPRVTMSPKGRHSRPQKNTAQTYWRSNLTSPTRKHLVTSDKPKRSHKFQLTTHPKQEISEEKIGWIRCWMIYK